MGTAHSTTKSRATRQRPAATNSTGATCGSVQAGDGDTTCRQVLRLVGNPNALATAGGRTCSQPCLHDRVKGCGSRITRASRGPRWTDPIMAGHEIASPEHNEQLSAFAGKNCEPTCKFNYSWRSSANEKAPFLYWFSDTAS